MRFAYFPLVHPFKINKSWLYFQIRPDKTVDTKIAVVRKLSKVTAVFITALAVTYAMILPFPDKAANNSIRRIQHPPIVRQISRTVAHCMAVFAQHKRSPFPRIFQVNILDPFGRSVHTADHIQRQIIIHIGIFQDDHALVMDEPCVVYRLDRFCRFGKTAVVPAFVA